MGILYTLEDFSVERAQERNAFFTILLLLERCLSTQFFAPFQHLFVCFVNAPLFLVLQTTTPISTSIFLSGGTDQRDSPRRGQQPRLGGPPVRSNYHGRADSGGRIPAPQGPQVVSNNGCGSGRGV